MRPRAPQQGFQSLPSGPKVGKYRIAILRSAGVDVQVLGGRDESSLEPDKKANLATKREKLEKAIKEVNEMFEPVKVS